MAEIDHVFVSVDWELEHTDSLLQALSSGISDHAPLHLSTSALCCAKRRFCFELYWRKLEGFGQAVRDAWICDDHMDDPNNAIIGRISDMINIFKDVHFYF